MFYSPALQFNKPIYEAITLTADRNTSAIDLSNSLMFAVHLIWTGTPTGTFNLQASNDGSNWVTVDSQAAGGAAGQKLFNVAAAGYAFVRVNYVFTSGTGSVTGYISGKC